MGDFSQSRGGDDLFDDEIIPIEDPPHGKITTELAQVSLEPTPVPPPVEAVSAAAPPQSEAVSAAAPPQSTPSDAPFPGRGGGPKKPSTGLEDSKWATKPAESAKPAQRTNNASKPLTEEAAQLSTTQSDTTITDQPAEASAGDTTSANTAPLNALTGPSNPASTLKTPAPPHTRAQADAASFEERERIAKEKREIERKDRRALEGERGRDRPRKLGGREGREWDRDKDDQVIDGRGGGRRNFDPRPFSAEEDDLRKYEWHEGVVEVVEDEVVAEEVEAGAVDSADNMVTAVAATVGLRTPNINPTCLPTPISLHYLRHLHSQRPRHHRFRSRKLRPAPRMSPCQDQIPCTASRLAVEGFGLSRSSRAN
ncbi:uncharacterized protein Z520_01983 [Fonsecaea multimorphosa CBS 102226]|uniref:Uncharacterized protein n=1 Tax=Fonsecaea multimorphosa CBS 102226 TaxID=1442371 RepID=A0A0D2KES9_9EURO|nr:uncharacterized protein Z520_01983 [Fonsecaea multimorphosa CBS 102226]KIY01845.1 hypothetical protein Z520_01983 [Fonsecaea multimorphosa CBS 102226]